MSPLIDTHNHLDYPGFDAERPALLAECARLGVVRQVLIGVEREQWPQLWRVTTENPGLYAAPGLHPLYLSRHQEADIEALRAFCLDLRDDRRLCAIGEIGLDYFIEAPDKARQAWFFEQQVHLAMELELPVLLHVRRAHADVVKILKRLKPPRAGIAHAFSGSYEEAREYLRLGFKLGLGGAPTWPQAKRLQRVLPQLPLDSIVLETDAPDMPPVMHPDRRNSPTHLPAICAALAPLWDVPAETLAATTTRNACAVFGWDDSHFA
ncbi:TatD family hydrolase [Pseudomonas sp. EpS/L25]|uniref:TatD family hydrolase n=1 Tax=Pseudomonas sp. EpS/L25 TaxID=1749078 RepID=UPI000743998B|nr:TatD family hydrolase [Pseudomonas sp. EpS/L25]KUM41567.1 hydrolase TatD [Pseudomonas sp. EpS/L25]